MHAVEVHYGGNPLAPNTVAGGQASGAAYEEMQPDDAAAGGSGEYDSAPLQSAPFANRGLQPAALEADYGGADSLLNMDGQQKTRTNTKRSRDAAEDAGAGARRSSVSGEVVYASSPAGSGIHEPQSAPVLDLYATVDRGDGAGVYGCVCSACLSSIGLHGLVCSSAWGGCCYCFKGAARLLVGPFDRSEHVNRTTRALS